MEQFSFRCVLLAASLGVLVSGQGTQDCKLDIALAIDTSGSIAVDAASGGSQQNWDDVSAFLVNLVGSFEVDPDKVKVGAVTFADNAEVEFNLNAHTTNDNLMAATQAITYPPEGGKTNTWQALEMIRDTIFESTNGDRSDVPNVVFLITDGKPNMVTNPGSPPPPEYTLQELYAIEETLIAQDNPRIIGVAVGPKVDYDVMERITDLYMNVTNFAGLDDVVDDIVEWACEPETTTAMPATTTTTVPRQLNTCPDPIENMYFFAATYQHTDKEGRIPIELGMTVPFQKVRTNKGDAYRNTTSVFKCPCAGWYQFTASMSDVTGIGIVIMRDDEVVSPMGYESERGHISTNTIIECDENQEVYVKLVMNRISQNYLHCNFNEDMVLGGFTGHLLTTVTPTIVP